MRCVLLVVLLPALAHAGVGDPQVRTDHPWYPGELACSTFDRLFATEAEVYKRITGRDCTTDEDKVLAAWLWRNTHYAHAEEGVEDLWGQGFGKGLDTRNRDYWTGLFAHGFGLCGTTHCQWIGEMEARLGHGRSRAIGAAGHSAFEVLLKGGPYGDGKWVLLDHDLSNIVYDADGKQLLGMREITADWKKLTDREFKPDRQHGWLICGLHPQDNGSYAQYQAAEYLAGYAGPPPMVHLRRGETLRRYLEPGLADGKTFVFWGRNYGTAGVPGPERSITWVNQPDAMFKSKTGAGYKPGQARFANAVYTYTPDFTSKDYKEGVVAEDDTHVTFEFRTPYIIAATPDSARAWGIYDSGCKNGLVVQGKGDATVSVSVDRGQTWSPPAKLADSPDLTDVVKGFRQYWLRVNGNAKTLAGSGLTIKTVCQANGTTMPRLTDGGSKVTFAASHRSLVSAGPTLPQAQAHLVEGAFGTPRVTLELATPRGEPIAGIYAAAHLNSSNPPDPKVKYQIEWSADSGKTWTPVVKDWTINRQADEPKDFWSQSFCWGSREIEKGNVSKVRVRFRNDGGKAIARAELHLVYRVENRDVTEVAFGWTDDAGPHSERHTMTDEKPWVVPPGKGVKTTWVELRPVRMP